ncbi:hypothetical protein DO71_3839 [Burkholderia pseudomallei]|nr:hypothetical protein DO71_3839 [Burkholderia pseudomallei]KGX69799.1 hypothetical protein Y026_4168 [Burkholderia pseudomallei TSV28]KGX99774.1 hypothetical protein Y023_3697 [Burkholderia pseudomallei A79D]
MALHWRKMQQHREPGGALNQSANRRAVKTSDQVAFPMPWNSTISNFCRAFTDRHLRSDEVLSALLRPGPRHTKCAARTQASSKLSSQSAPTLNVECLIDSFVGDPHRLIIGIVNLNSPTDLLRAPASGPATVRMTSLSSSFPRNVRSGNRLAPIVSDRSSQAILHICPQLVVLCQFRSIRTLGCAFSFPLGNRCPIHQSTTAGRCVTA